VLLRQHLHLASSNTKVHEVIRNQTKTSLDTLTSPFIQIIHGLYQLLPLPTSKRSAESFTVHVYPDILMTSGENSLESSASWICVFVSQCTETNTNRDRSANQGMSMIGYLSFLESVFHHFTAMETHQHYPFTRN